MKVEDFLNINKTTLNEVKYKISKIKEKEDGVLIYLDNNEKINVSVENYFRYSLSSIKGLDENLYKLLRDEEIIFLAYKGALRKLSVKDYTVKQIKDYLIIRKKIDDNNVSIIINKLVEYGLLDDDKYCLNRYSYLNKQLLSNKKIKFKLQKEGISKDLIDKYVININDDEYGKAYKLAVKYSNTIKNKSLNAIKQNILSKIVNAGYSYDAARNAVDKLNLVNPNELLLLNKDYFKAKKKYENKYDGYDLKNHIYSYLVNKGYKTEDIKKEMEDIK